ncbi:MAG: hypothetical protein H7222_15120 [Methylotenera sp.]|nr:hypothetical protein [Oligoflexia bacterium]
MRVQLHRFSTLLPTGLLLLGLTAGTSSQSEARVSFDSGQQILLDAEIQNGVMLSPAGTSERELNQAIRNQLSYTIGQLAVIDAAPRVNRFEVTVVQIEEVPAANGEPAQRRIHYRAKGQLAWGRNWRIPAQIELILPSQGHEIALTAFGEHYLKPCSTDKYAENWSLFYYFHPLMAGCPLQIRNTATESDVVRFPVSFAVSRENSTGKSPEYGEIWKDGKLTVTAIFGKYSPESTSKDDDGLLGYNDFHEYLLQQFGQPTTRSETFLGAPGLAHPVLDLSFRSYRGPILVHMELIDSMTQTPPEFKKRFVQNARDADLVIYSGHSELGGSMEALSNLMEFSAGKYQIFLVNGCGSFSHLNDRLFEKRALINPEAAASKYLDVISNSLSNYFVWMPIEAVNLITDLSSRSRPGYRQILDRFDPRQRVVVEGEEDNHWPL